MGEVAPDKEKYQRGEKKPGDDDEEARKLKMGKGTVPDKKDDDEKVKLKPIPEKQVNFINAAMLQKNDILIMTLKISHSQTAEKVELKPETKVINF